MSEQPKLDLEAVKSAIVQTIALLDVAIAGTVFTKPDAGRVVVNVAKAQSALDGLRGAFALIARVQEGEDWETWCKGWHGAVEAILTIYGLSPALGATEAVEAMRALLFSSPSTPKAGDEGR